MLTSKSNIYILFIGKHSANFSKWETLFKKGIIFHPQTCIFLSLLLIFLCKWGESKHFRGCTKKYSELNFYLHYNDCKHFCQSLYYSWNSRDQRFRETSPEIKMNCKHIIFFILFFLCVKIHLVNLF